MASLRDNIRFSYETSEGRPIKHKNLVVTPVSRVLTIRIPFWGYVWNRPVGVHVENGGSTIQVAIVDVTLLAQLGLLSLGLAASIVGLLLGRHRHR